MEKTLSVGTINGTLLINNGTKIINVGQNTIIAVIKEYSTYKVVVYRIGDMGDYEPILEGSRKQAFRVLHSIADEISKLCNPAKVTVEEDDETNV